MRLLFKEDRTMKTKAILTAILLLAVGVIAKAENTWTVTNPSGSTFRITRSGDTSISETVKYRTVSLSAYAGQHYTAVSGEVTFGPSDTYKEVTVSEYNPGNTAYTYQTGTTRKYRFEVTDPGGFYMAHLDREITTGTSIPDSGAFSIKDIVIQDAEYLNTDDGYDKNVVKSVASSTYFNNAAPKVYYQFVGAELRMTLSMDVKESDDGYQYLSILNSTTLYDNRTDCSNGDPGNINNSIYMAGFEHKTGGKDTEYKSYSFPVTSVGNNAGHSNPWGHGTSYILSKQKFKTNCRASDGRINLPMNFSVVAVRCNASGSDEDDWYAKSVTAHIQAVDNNAPAVLAYSVAPGYHAKGNTVYVSVAFNEIVTGSSAGLTSNWGDLSYVAGSGSNVLTFQRTIDSSTALNITGCYGITDLAGNAPSSVSADNICSVDDNYAYTITYDLDGGSVATENPTSYTYESDAITLNKPTKTDYIFNGWTGSNGDAPQTTVTIANHSHGNKSYTANFEHIKYYVSFNKNHEDATGSMTNQVFELNEEKALSANEFIRTGYRFVEWNTKADGQGTAYSNQQVVLNLSNTHNAIVRLYAKWEPVYGVGNGADGSEANPYQITSIADLEYLASMVNSNKDLYYGKFFKLMNDISFPHGDDATENNYTTIGSGGDGFKGTFDGQGFTISGVRIYLPNKYYVGLFGRVRGTIRNLIIDDASITGSQYVSGIVAVNLGEASVQNCLVTGSTISGTTAGVIVGSNSGSTSRNYYRNCSVGGNTQNIGTSTGDRSGAKALYTISLGDHIITGSRADGTTVGANKTFYADGISIDGTEYYTSGATVTLGYNGEIPDGYAVWYTITDVGTRNTNTFTMPSSDVSVSAIINPALINYIGANGEIQARDGLTTAIVSGTGEYGNPANGETWYYVRGEQTINGSLSIYDQNVNIILLDGATLTVPDFNVPNGSLSIYAQSDGNQRGRIVVNGGITATYSIDVNGGSVSAVTGGEKAIYTINGNITIRRGAVNAEGTKYGLYAKNALTIDGGTVSACSTDAESGSGIYTYSDEVKILGGNVTATGHDGIIPSFGKSSNAKITLGWSKPTDSITASSYIMHVYIVDGQRFTYGDGSVTISHQLTYLTEEIKDTMKNQTLRPKATNEDASRDLTARSATLAGQTRYWTTFYHPSWNYTLPAGAQAFILKSDKVLYRVGDGTMVPANCAVVIMADSASITLTATNANAPAVSGNILQGTTATTAAPAGSRVLSKVNGTFGFFEFTDDIPANKAYYVE